MLNFYVDMNMSNYPQLGRGTD